jgi:replication factor C small subunit
MLEYIWSQKYRPQQLSDMVLSDENRILFESFLKDKQIPNLMFAGLQGIGKTTMAKVLCKELGVDYLYINASDETGIDTIRHKVISFAETRSLVGDFKVVILDEADGLSGTTSSGRSSAQQALRNVMEEYSANTRFILTANYPSKIIPALHSRCQSVSFNPPLNKVATFVVDILKKENVSIPKEQKERLLRMIKSGFPDIRKVINSLQQHTIDGVLSISEDSEQIFIAEKVLKMVLNKKPLEEIRKYIISQESDFNDYHDLLTNLFEAIFNSDLPQDKKASMMLVITEAMYRHSIVMDQEINCFGAIIQMSTIV